jgi:hypothetical protein
MILNVKKLFRPETEIEQLRIIVMVLAAAIAIVVVAIMAHELWPITYSGLGQSEPAYSASDRADMTSLVRAFAR